MGESFYCCDVPLTAIQAIPGASHQSNHGEVLLYPGGMARAEIKIPPSLQGAALTAHVRSGWARLGIHTTGIRTIHFDGDERMSVGIRNWAPYGIIIRAGDQVIALANSGQMSQLPLVEAIPLHAGPAMLLVKQHLLPSMDVPDGHGNKSTVFYIDPYTKKLPHIIEEVPWAAGWFRRNHFLVITAVEQPFIPEGHTGIIGLVIQGSTHSSATLDHELSCGRRALEMTISRKKVWLEPGMHVATLHIYPTPGIPPSSGVYRNRTSIVPLSPATNEML